MSKKSLLTLLLSAFLLVSPSVSTAKTYNNAIGDPEKSEQGFIAITFRDYLADKTDGRIDIVNHYSSALYDETEALRNLQRGALPFAVVGVANLVPFDKRLGVLTLPYIFENVDEAVEGTTGSAAELLNSWALEKGFRILGWAYTDFRYPSNSVRPIRNIKDIEGLKFRVPGSAVLISAYKAFGASPTPISWAETFTALQQGVVDGQDIGFLIFKTMKFNEANQKYISEVHYTYQLQPLVVSERVFSTFSKEDQALMIEAGKIAQEAVLQYQLTEGEKAKQELIAMGVQVDVLEDEEEWIRRAYEIVWPEMMEFVGGKDIINSYLKAMNKSPWEPK